MWTSFFRKPGGLRGSAASRVSGNFAGANLRLRRGTHLTQDARREKKRTPTLCHWSSSWEKNEQIFPFQVFGTDLSERAIQTPGRGYISENIGSDVNPGAAATILLQSRRWLPDQEGNSRSLHFFHAECIQRSAFFPHGFGKLPKCDDLPESIPAEEGNSDLSLCIESHRVSCNAGKYRRPSGRGFGALRNDR